MRVTRSVSLIALAVFGANATTTTTPWYVWQYRIDNTMTVSTTCAKTAPGTWVQVSGPFKDARCSVPVSL
jgi:hypothetical protein